MLEKKKRKKGSICWAISYGITVTAFTVFVLLDTFVIPHKIAAEVNEIVDAGKSTAAKADQSVDSEKSVAAKVSGNSYKDENVSISITTKTVEDTNIYIADIQLSDVSYLKTALAQNTYGRNIKETTSEMAENNEAILAVNGDYYGYRNSGYVIRNGILYRSESSGADDLVIFSDGRFEIINEDTYSAETLMEKGAVQALSFGPALVQDGTIQVSENTEVEMAKSSNPRTAIGMVGELHYIVVVSDGRTDESEGLSLYELAEVMKEAGCTVAYNLDGGGSSTMWFQGKVVNNPTDGHKNGERRVSDIVYVG